MTTVLYALSAALLGTLASVATQRFVAALRPGLDSLSRWVMIAGMVAGAVLGGLSVLVAAFTVLRAASIVALACRIVVVTQIAGWLLFLQWLRPGLAVRSVQKRYPVRDSESLLLPQGGERIQ